MKLSVRLILLFSILALITVSLNTFFSMRAENARLVEQTNVVLEATGKHLVFELEQALLMMDYALETMTGSAEFMEAMYTVWQQGEYPADPKATLAAQNLLSDFLYHIPLNESFYRVSIYNSKGFFLSSRFDKNDSITCYSDEMLEALSTIPWLDDADRSPHHHMILAPHKDPWTQARSVSVYGAAIPAYWKGQHIGYLEVVAQTSELDRIFQHDQADMFVYAVIGDKPFYSDENDTMNYESLALGSRPEHVDDGSGNDRILLKTGSKWLDISIVLSQELTAFREATMQIVNRHVTIGLIIWMGACLAVVLLSMGLTRSLRRLSAKMRNYPVDQFVSLPNMERSRALVTSAHDLESREMEHTFETMLDKLHDTVENEMVLREKTLTAQLSALQAQINPHFVYNTLNIISGKALENDNIEICQLCSQFAQMLRYSTDTRSQSSTLEEELWHVRAYLTLLKARHEDNLTYTLGDMPENAMGVQLPKLCLQPLVENAIAHGMTPDRLPMHIELRGELTGDTLAITVRDNGVGFPPDTLNELNEGFLQIEHGILAVKDGSAHLGLLNTYRRLYIFSKGTTRMRLRNDSGAVITLLINIRKEL